VNLLNTPGDAMTALKSFCFITGLLILLGIAACSNFTVVEDAVKKQGTALYYYRQKDYKNARMHCEAALKLWDQIKRSKKISYPDWAVDDNIETCQEIMEHSPIAEKLIDVTVVPIKIRRNRIFVKVLLNGKQSALFLLDTGATSSLLNPDLAEQLGLVPDKDTEMRKISLIGDIEIDMPFVTISQISVGEATVKNLRVGVYDVEPDAPHIKGILGEDFLSCYAVSIDPKSRQLKLTAK
jgi:predicted aspartyl protease